MNLVPRDVLKKLGVPADLIHMNGRLYVDHLLGVCAGLVSWGFPSSVQLAGLIHSIYGTERFDGWRIGLMNRQLVAELVGADAELLAYVNCELVRSEFDEKVVFGGASTITGRFGLNIVFENETVLEHLYAVQLADWLDQVRITGEWGYRRRAYRAMANRLGGRPLETFLTVYRNGPRTTGEG